MAEIDDVKAYYFCSGDLGKDIRIKINDLADKYANIRYGKVSLNEYEYHRDIFIVNVISMIEEDKRGKN